jgi:hypothetical protein
VKGIIPILLIVLVVLLACERRPTSTAPPPPDNSAEIAALRKQVEELARQLHEVQTATKRTPAATPTTSPLSSIAGTYLNVTKPSEYMELRPDGTYSALYRGVAYSGTFEFDTKRFIFKNQYFAHRALWSRDISMVSCDSDQTSFADTRWSRATASK